MNFRFDRFHKPFQPFDQGLPVEGAIRGRCDGGYFGCLAPGIFETGENPLTGDISH
jgi:hypothetical protein